MYEQSRRVSRGGLLADWQILELASGGMIKPFAESSPRGVISYGLSSYGYDARLGRKFRIATRREAWEIPAGEAWVIDPKNFDDRVFRDYEGDTCLIPPNSFALAHTIEYFDMPRDVLAVCVGKSTYARCGVIVNVTPLEPGWCGEVTMEISNTTPRPVRLYAGEGICQFLFFHGAAPAATYADRSGKYQGQVGVVGARI